MHRLLGELGQGPVHPIAVQGLFMICLEPGRPVRLHADDPGAEQILGTLAHALGDSLEDRLVVRREVRKLASTECGHDAPSLGVAQTPR
ncbi:MAG: hypothetical protein ACRD96_26480 [Bryobacteraceae bacterium]